LRIPVDVPAARGLDVLGVGQNTIDQLCVVDTFPTIDSKQPLRGYDVQPGGQVATALVALARWGLRTAYVGSFGDDDGGRRSRARLAAEGVDLSSAVVRDCANQLSVILVDGHSGERTVLWHRDAALTLRVDEVPLERVAGARVLHVDGLDGAAALAAASAARAARVPVVADIDTAVHETAGLLPLVDILIVSWEFARAYTGASAPESALDVLARDGAAVVAVTTGPTGVVARAGSQTVRAPGFPVSAVDTTGAGDLFHAGFVWSVLHGLELEAALRFGNAAAALQCTGLGGRRAIPTLAAARALAGI